MLHARMVELLWRALPVPAWKSGLARHMENCPACAARLADRKEVRRVLIQAGDLDGPDDLWPRVRRALDGNPETRPSAVAERSALKAGEARSAPFLRWAAALGGTALAVTILIGTIRYLGETKSGGPGPVVAETDGFILHSASIENKPAETYIIHPQDDGLIVVWVEKTH